MAKIKMGMRPIHPGVFFWQEVLEELGLSIATAADLLGVRRATLSDLINEKASLSAEMAVRIEKVFGSYGVSAKSLMEYQTMLDLWEVEQEAEKLNVKKYQAA